MRSAQLVALFLRRTLIAVFVAESRASVNTNSTLHLQNLTTINSSRMRTFSVSMNHVHLQHGGVRGFMLTG